MRRGRADHNSPPPTHDSLAHAPFESSNPSCPNTNDQGPAWPQGKELHEAEDNTRLRVYRVYLGYGSSVHVRSWLVWPETESGGEARDSRYGENRERRRESPRAPSRSTAVAVSESVDPWKRDHQNHGSMFAVSCRRPPRPRLLALRVGAVLTLLEDASAGCTRLLAVARTKRQFLPP